MGVCGRQGRSWQNQGTDVHLSPFHAAICEGISQNLEPTDTRWISVDEIDQNEFCPANEEILRRLKDAY